MWYILVIFLFSLIDSFANEILNISKFKNLIAITFGCVFLNLIFIAYQFFYFSIKSWRLPVIKNHLLIWKLLMIFCIDSVNNNIWSRISHGRCYIKINFAIFTGKQLCWSLFLIKLLAWRPILKDICEQRLL